MNTNELYDCLENLKEQKLDAVDKILDTLDSGQIIDYCQRKLDDTLSKLKGDNNEHRHNNSTTTTSSIDSNNNPVLIYKINGVDIECDKQCYICDYHDGRSCSVGLGGK